MTRAYSILINWHNGMPKQIQLETELTKIGDWLRISQYAYIILSDLDAAGIQQSLGSVMSQHDNQLIVSIDFNDINGWAPKWVWDWLFQRRDKVNNPLLAGLFPNNTIPTPPRQESLPPPPPYIPQKP